MVPAILILLAAAQQPPSGFVEMTEPAHASVRRGLSWLTSRQGSSGAFAGSGGAPVATSALCGLALLAGGHAPGRSADGAAVERTLGYLLSSQRNGYFSESGGAEMHGGSRMHGHGYATLFVTQAYGVMDESGRHRREDVAKSIQDAVRLIERCQSPEGGWYYYPQPQSDEGSVTITQVTPLRAAREAGIPVDDKVVAKAINYIKKSTGSDGQVAYSLSQAGSRSSSTLTAAGMTVWTHLGLYEDPKVIRGLDSLVRGTPSQFSHYYFYGNYYATVAMYQAGRERWQTWFPKIRDELVKTQQGNGSWTGTESQRYGPEFSTALALLILEMPYRQLPIFQRPED